MALVNYKSEKIDLTFHFNSHLSNFCNRTPNSCHRLLFKNIEFCGIVGLQVDKDICNWALKHMPYHYHLLMGSISKIRVNKSKVVRFEVLWSLNYVLDPLFEVGLTQNLVEHE